jgi:hypothetical protein
MKKMTAEQESIIDECSKGSSLLQPTYHRKDKKQFQTIPKRGEKDFEPDGTKKQQNMLQEGREAMYMALSADAGLYSLYLAALIEEKRVPQRGYG